MKTLLFTLEYPPFYGGVANYYSNLIKYWPKAKLKVGDIFVLNNNDDNLISKRLFILKWLPALLKLWKVIKQEKINNVLVGQILPLGIVTYLISKVIKIKYTVFLHGMDFTFAIKQPRKRWITKIILKNSNKIICANSCAADLAQNFCQEIKNKINIINPGIEDFTTRLPQLELQLKIKYSLQSKLILLSVGRLVKRKGFDKVIECLHEVLKKVPNLIYIIIGNGVEVGSLQAKIDDLKLVNKVIIITNADDQEKNAWMNLSDIFVMRSININGDFEGFGIVYLEANLANKPVIAGQSGGVGDAVINGLNGLLVDSEKNQQLIDAIIKLAKDPLLRHKLGEQGRQRALKEFNWQKQIEMVAKLILK
ncbi:glycosyltransferase family 4 protein [Patescibacteria group bacterium]|nr:glycosyltransferase family 4 protein [Patescibacteria group bacterium]MBU1870799.1 glycosyltransferase family 4 protein [Patescibacteria group bacterium]